MRLGTPLLAVALAAALGPPAAAASRPFAIVNDGRSYAAFRIEDTLETIDGTTNKVAGSITFDPDALSSSSATASVDLPSLDTGVALRDSEMRSTLDTEHFPAATFKTTVISGAPATLAVGQSADFRAGGDFTLHGVTRRISAPVHLVRESGDRIHATMRFTIRMTDFNIAVPDKLVVSVANEVVIRVDVFATAR